MATAMPYNGGLVAWVGEAMGPLLGNHCAYWMWLSDLTDAAVYPCLAASYLADVIPLDRFAGGRAAAQALLAMMMVLLVTAIKLCGSNVLVAFSSLLLALSLLPAVLYICWGFTVQQPAQWLSLSFHNPDAEIDWTLFISWTLWLYGGFIRY